MLLYFAISFCIITILLFIAIYFHISLALHSFPSQFPLCGINNSLFLLNDKVSSATSFPVLNSDAETEPMTVNHEYVFPGVFLA